MIRRISIATAALSVAFLSGGCATKKFVSQSIEPMQQRVDQLDQNQTKQGESIAQLNKDVEGHDTEISAAKERIGTAETRIGDAGNRISENERGLNELRSRIANIDDYREVQQVSVLFGFDKDALTPEAEAQLREVAGSANGGKRFFITVEGYTDQIGSPEYNFALSQRRADRVVRYLVAEFGIPIHRIHVIGLGQERLVEDDNSREARAKNRRVEVKVFSADALATSAKGSN